MNVSGVNSVAFAGQRQITKKGNEYEKTNTGKKVGLLVGVGIETLRYARKSSRELTMLYYRELAKTSKLLAASSVVAGAAMVLGLGVGLGAIVDGFVNRARRKKADKAAMA